LIVRLKFSFFIYFSLFITTGILTLSAQNLIVVNRTGFNLIEMNLIQDNTPGENLIPYDVILDQSYLEIPITLEEEMLFRLVDESGDVYLKQFRMLSGQPKIVITLNDLQVLSPLSGSLRLHVKNSMGYPISSIYVSSADSNDWGEDLLKGGILRDQETLEIEIPQNDASLYDIRFTCYQDNQYIEYILKSEKLRDLGIFTLRSL